MRTQFTPIRWMAIVFAGLMLGSPAAAQEWSNVVIPQRGVVMPQGVEIAHVDVGIEIREQAARTSLTITLRNSTSRPQEAQLLLPVPEGSSVSRFRLEGLPDEGIAKMLPLDEARRIYEDIVRRTRDPGLVEFVGMGLIRTSVFPVPAGGSQVLELTYERVIPSDAGRIDYVLPRSSSLETGGVVWSIRATLRHAAGLGAIYSPTHELSIERSGDDAATARVLNPESSGELRLSFLVAGSDGPSSSVMMYPDANGEGGYFLLLAGVPKPEAGSATIRREITLVLDRSGSMRGEKLEQAKAAALQVIEALGDGELFNIIDYSDSIEAFAAAPVERNSKSVAAARVYLEGIRAVGGTNIHDAMLEALRPAPAAGVLPMVLFLTDGLPTVGQTRESLIRDAIASANTHKRRIFAFGVGHDVNTPLLTAMSLGARGVPTFVGPSEDVEVKVGQVFRRLAGPVLASPSLRAMGEDGPARRGAVRDVLPRELPDVFEGDQLVAIGRYESREALNLTLSGNYLGRDRMFSARLDPAKASVSNGFVPRLWASRKIGVLLDELRQAGADGVVDPASDPKLRELVDSVIALSTEWGILTEYTAFLAAEPADFARAPAPAQSAMRERLAREAQSDRHGGGGRGAVRDEMNVARQNVYRIDADNSAAAGALLSLGIASKDEAEALVLNVRQVADRALYHQDGRWVEAQLLSRDDAPQDTVEFASAEYFALALRLAREGRQSLLALGGDIELVVDGRRTLVRGPST